MLAAFLFAMLFSFTSCDKDNQEEEAAAIVAEWQLYRSENLESIIDEWTGTEWTYVDKWFASNWADSGSILGFNSDGTFDEYYEDVPVFKGTWETKEDGIYYFTYTVEDGGVNEQLLGRRVLTKLCDNTISIEKEGNDRSIDYYRQRATIECSDLITYKVQ